MISLLLLPFFACTILVLIHVYFGSLVLKRGIIFIDIALAQWAALGYLVGHWLDIDNAILLFLLSFLFTILASLALIVLKPLYMHLNLQEASIGIVYIAATSIATVLITMTGMEGHHLKDMLSGHLLFLQSYEIISAAILYIVIAIVVCFFHRFISSSQSIKSNLLFYVLFSLVVTSSVKMVGILLVFSFLVLPMMSIILFTNQLKKQLLYAWGIGLFGSISGLFISIILDIPPSFSVIFALLAIWIFSIFFKIKIS